jgi:glycerophosphoryl diester phosphodiesterase
MPRSRAASLVLVAGALVSSCGPVPELSSKLGLRDGLVIAHRGASLHAPEHTLASYWLARQLGSDFIELDVQLTRDGQIVVFHDDDPSRTTNAAKVFPGREKGHVGSFTWAELGQLDAGSWFNAAFPQRARPSFARGLRVLRLSDALDIAERKDEPGTPDLATLPGLYIETKNPSESPGIEDKLVAELKARQWITPEGQLMHGRKLVFQSFQELSLEKLRRLAPGVPRALLMEQEVDLDAAQARIERARALGHGIGPHGMVTRQLKVLTAIPFAHAAHQRGLLVHPWVLNTPWQVRLWRWFGADGVISDAPDVALATLGRKTACPLDECLGKLDPWLSSR